MKKILSFIVCFAVICSTTLSFQFTNISAESSTGSNDTSFYENLSEAEFSEDDTITVLSANIPIDDAKTKCAYNETFT